MIESTSVDDLFVITPNRISDQRGFFSETYSSKALETCGFSDSFVQDNHSLSRSPGVIRGLHFQKPPFPQAKLIRVLKGAIFDVAVDLRSASPSYGKHFGIELSSENWKQLLVPVGFAHGFCTLQPDTEIAYKVTDFYSPECDAGLRWDDPGLGIDWPVDASKAILSEKDRQQPMFADFVSPF